MQCNADSALLNCSAPLCTLWLVCILSAKHQKWQAKLSHPISGNAGNAFRSHSCNSPHSEHSLLPTESVVPVLLPYDPLPGLACTWHLLSSVELRCTTFCWCILLRGTEYGVHYTICGQQNVRASAFEHESKAGGHAGNREGYKGEKYFCRVQFALALHPQQSSPFRTKKCQCAMSGKQGKWSGKCFRPTYLTIDVDHSSSDASGSAEVREPQLYRRNEMSVGAWEFAHAQSCCC